jgi:hypothetical protein
MGLTLIAGRDFSSSDRAGAPRRHHQQAAGSLA